MRSRTSRYALFETRRNQRLAKNTGGTMTSTPSASCHDIRDDHDHRAGEQEDVLHEQHETLRDQLLHRVDVGRHAGDDLAGLLPLEEVERQRHQVVEQPLAQLAQERLADRGDEQDREPAEDQAGERHERGTARRRGSARPRRCSPSPWSMP